MPNKGDTRLGPNNGRRQKWSGKYWIPLCSSPACPHYAQNGGFCVGHGGTIPRCSVDGCSNNALKSGVCTKHGAQRDPCVAPGCSTPRVKGGKCVAHGAITTRCGFTGCEKKARRGGVCVEHGATEPKCAAENCEKNAKRKGVCAEHGATPLLCSEQGCTNLRLKGGVCASHGAQQPVCSSPDCGKQAKRGGACAAHQPRCNANGCTNAALGSIGSGLCEWHESYGEFAEPCNVKQETRRLYVVHHAGKGWCKVGIEARKTSARTRIWERHGGRLVFDIELEEDEVRQWGSALYATERSVHEMLRSMFENPDEGEYRGIFAASGYAETYLVEDPKVIVDVVVREWTRADCKENE